MIYDAVIVGGGPAGLSAATWLGRYRRSVLVVDSGEYRNRWVDRSHGYLGSDPASPMELLERARRDLRRYPNVEICHGTASAARRDERGRFVVTVGNEDFVALRMVLASGVVDRFPEVGNFFEHYGASVFHCPTCDGYEAQGKRVVVFGWSENVAGFCLTLQDWAGSLTVVTDGRSFEGEEAHRRVFERNGVELLEDDVVELVGTRGDLRGVVLAGGRTLDADLVFFSIAHHPRLTLAEQLGCEITEEQCLLVDQDCMTSVEGLYAAGDITPGFQLASVAVGKGAVAGVACASSLRGELGAPGSPVPAPDCEAELEAATTDVAEA